MVATIVMAVVAVVGVLTATVVAMMCVRCVVVKEATAVAFKYLGGFAYLAMEFKDHYLDGVGTVWPGSGPNSFGDCWCIWRIGGWVFYIYPLVKPADYGEQNEPDKFGEGIYVRLGDITPEPRITEAETSGGIALNVKFVSTMRVVNPYRWLFPSPKDVNAQVVKRQDAILRSWVRSGDENHAQSARGDGKQLWIDIVTLGCKPVFEKIESDWGLKILENSIVVEDVGYDPEYQAALKAEKQAKLVAKATAVEAGSPIDQLMDQWIKDKATKLGITVLQATKDSHADRTWDAQITLYKDLILANSGNLTVFRNEVGSPNGGPLPAGLTYLSVGGTGGGAGVFVGGNRGGNRGGGRSGGRGDHGGGRNNDREGGFGGGSDNPVDNDRKTAADTFRQTGRWPEWWDPMKQQRR